MAENCCYLRVFEYDSMKDTFDVCPPGFLLMAPRRALRACHPHLARPFSQNSVFFLFRQQCKKTLR